MNFLKAKEMNELLIFITVYVLGAYFAMAAYSAVFENIVNLRSEISEMTIKHFIKNEEFVTMALLSWFAVVFVLINTFMINVDNRKYFNFNLKRNFNETNY
jgi:hypothetical protein